MDLLTKEDYQQLIYIKEEWENLEPEEAMVLELILAILDKLYHQELSFGNQKGATAINTSLEKLIREF